jgi:hypothetical protein
VCREKSHGITQLALQICTTFAGCWAEQISQLREVGTVGVRTAAPGAAGFCLVGFRIREQLQRMTLTCGRGARLAIEESRLSRASTVHIKYVDGSKLSCDVDVHANHVDERFGEQLLHRPGPVLLDAAHANAEQLCRFAVRSASHDKIHHFPLAWAQKRQSTIEMRPA